MPRTETALKFNMKEDHDDLTNITFIRDVTNMARGFFSEDTYKPFQIIIDGGSFMTRKYFENARAVIPMVIETIRERGETSAAPADLRDRYIENLETVDQILLTWIKLLPVQPYKIGEFIEFFDLDAERVAEALGIPVTKIKVKGEMIPVTGIYVVHWPRDQYRLLQMEIRADPVKLGLPYHLR